MRHPRIAAAPNGAGLALHNGGCRPPTAKALMTTGVVGEALRV